MMQDEEAGVYETEEMSLLVKLIEKQIPINWSRLTENQFFRFFIPEQLL